MKHLYKSPVWIVFLILIGANIGLFVSGMSLSDKISYYEDSIHTYHRQNIDLERQAVEAGSLSFSASEAAKLGFVKQANPVYLEKVGVARAQR